MKKILIAISDDFLLRTYSKLLSEANFQVLEVRNGKEALDLAKKEIPDIILADVFLSEMGGLELAEVLKRENLTKKIPVIIFAKSEREEDRIKAMELGVKDFIVGATTPPPEVILRIKVHLGSQKTYQLLLQDTISSARELAEDLGYSPTLTCSRCGYSLALFLIRDLSKGRNYFKVSFICPKCNLY